MVKKYFQDALQTFNGSNWYGWKTHDDSGNKIPNKDRMQYKYIKIIKEGATMPSEADVNAKIQELKELMDKYKEKKTMGFNIETHARCCLDTAGSYQHLTSNRC